MEKTLQKLKLELWKIMQTIKFIEFDSVDAKYVRLDVTDSVSDQANGRGKFATLRRG